MALDVKFLTGTQADYEALEKAGLIEAKTFYYITVDASTTKLYLGDQELTNQEVYNILGGTPVKLENGTTVIQIDGNNYNSIIDYIKNGDHIFTGAITLPNTIKSAKGDLITLPTRTGTLATTQDVSELIASGGIDYLGAITLTADFTDYEGSVSKGDYFRVANNNVTLPDNKSDTTSFITCYAGDLIVAEKPAPELYVDGTNWSYIESHDTDTTYIADELTLTLDTKDNKFSLSPAYKDKVDQIDLPDAYDDDGIVKYVSDQITSYDTETLATKYVTKETGKGLSSNDYTNDDKNKLDGIAAGAQVNVIETIQFNGANLTATGKTVNIVAATTDQGSKADTALQPVSGATKNNFAGLNADGTLTDSGSKASDFATAAQGGKADSALQPVSGATSGNFAGLNADGTLTDSGKKASDFDAAGTAAGLVGTQKTATKDATGVYKNIQGDTTVTVADCVQAINKVYDNTTATDEIVSQIDYNVKGIYNIQQNLNQQLQWNEIKTLEITFNNDSTKKDKIYYISGQSWGYWIEEPLNSLNVSKTPTGLNIIKKVEEVAGEVTYYLVTGDTYVKPTDAILSTNTYEWSLPGEGENPDDTGGTGGNGDTKVKVTVDAANQGFENNQAVGDLSFDKLTIYHSNGTNTTNEPTYFTNGSTIRIYSGNTITFTSTASAITKIDFKCTQGAGLLESDVETYSSNGTTEGAWSGNATSVKFTNKSTSSKDVVRITEYYVEYNK